jgi:hypothetical protein
LPASFFIAVGFGFRPLVTFSHPNRNYAGACSCLPLGSGKFLRGRDSYPHTPYARLSRDLLRVTAGAQALIVARIVPAAPPLGNHMVHHCGCHPFASLVVATIGIDTDRMPGQMLRPGAAPLCAIAPAFRRTPPAFVLFGTSRAFASSPNHKAGTSRC